MDKGFAFDPTKLTESTLRKYKSYFRIDCADDRKSLNQAVQHHFQNMNIDCVEVLQRFLKLKRDDNDDKRQQFDKKVDADVRALEQASRGMINSIQLIQYTMKTEEKIVSSESPKADGRSTKYSECVICLEDKVKGFSLKPCGHSFCRKCIRLWLKRQQTCPLCRECPTNMNLEKRTAKVREPPIRQLNQPFFFQPVILEAAFEPVYYYPVNFVFPL